MEARTSCAICYNKLNNFFSLTMPLKLCCTVTPNTDTASLSFAQCANCKTIQLDILVPLHILYSDSHNYNSVGKVWDAYFARFVSLIENSIIDKNILEIGDPSGKIANRCEKYKKWFIIEPNKNNKIIFNEKIEFIEKFFDDSFTTNESLDMIIHSHLLEHIYDPNVFLKKCYEVLNQNGEMFFGVPDMEFIALNQIAPCLGIFFEHTIFLNKKNILWLLEKNGFQVINCLNYESHSIFFHVKKVNYISHIQLSIPDYYNLFFESLNTYKIFIKDCNAFIEKNLNKKIFIFGASYNTQFLLSLGLDANKLHGIIDNCKEKHGNFLYGSDLQIYSTDVLKHDNCAVILKNGYYSDEIRRQLLTINKYIDVFT